MSGGGRGLVHASGGTSVGGRAWDPECIGTKPFHQSTDLLVGLIQLIHFLVRLAKERWIMREAVGMPHFCQFAVRAFHFVQGGSGSQVENPKPFFRFIRHSAVVPAEAMAVKSKLRRCESWSAPFAQQLSANPSLEELQDPRCRHRAGLAGDLLPVLPKRKGWD